MLQGLNLLSTKQIEDQKRADEDVNAKMEYLKKDNEAISEELALGADKTIAPDADALIETVEQKEKRKSDRGICYQDA